MEGKRLGKKIPPGLEAITNRLGASTVVINTLQRPVAEEHLFFLKDVAEQARAILETIRKIEEGPVGEDFAFLALDTCGLVYVIINECDKIVNRGENVPEKFKWETGELEGLLKKIQAFMDKKIARGVLKRIYKQNKDHDKVDTYRKKLQNSMKKFGVFDQKSIQDILEEVISEKVLQHNILSRHAQGLGRNDSITSVTVQLAQNMVAMTSLEKPLPVVIVDDAESDRAAAVLNRLDAEREERRRKEEELRNLKVEDEARRKVRLAQIQQAKKAEKARWRRSEQEFHRLPDATAMLSPAHRPLGRPSSPEETAPSIVISDSESDSEDDVTSIPARSSTPLKDQLRDQQIARQLQEQFDREVESEKRMKERQALKLALKLQRELDEEDEDDDLSDSEESDPEDPPPPPGRRREESSPSRPPRRPRSLPTPAQNYSSPIPPMAGPPFGVFPQGPPAPGYFHPGYIPHAVHPSTSFSSLQGSAVSMGGGSVSLINSNSGNTHSFNIRDSFNDNSVRMGRDSDSD